MPIMDGFDFVAEVRSRPEYQNLPICMFTASLHMADVRKAISLDIDGTVEVGDPPGAVTMEMVRRSVERGHIVGSCSDRPLSTQRKIFAEHGVEPQRWLAPILKPTNLDGRRCAVRKPERVPCADHVLRTQRKQALRWVPRSAYVHLRCQPLGDHVERAAVARLSKRPSALCQLARARRLPGY